MHGVESANLAHGISHRDILQMGGDGEILQFIEDEVEFIILLGMIDPDQGFAERYILEVVR